MRVWVMWNKETKSIKSLQRFWQHSTQSYSTLVNHRINNALGWISELFTFQMKNSVTSTGHLKGPALQSSFASTCIFFSFWGNKILCIFYLIGKLSKSFLCRRELIFWMIHAGAWAAEMTRVTGPCGDFPRLIQLKGRVTRQVSCVRS